MCVGRINAQRCGWGRYTRQALCRVSVSGDGRPVYGMGGLDGLGGRIGGQDTTSGDWTDPADEYLHVAKVRVAGSNPVVRSLYRAVRLVTVG